MAEKMKFSACHNAAVFDRDGKDHCAVCHAPCEIADSKEAIAAHEAEGHDVEAVLSGSPVKNTTGSESPAPVAKINRIDLPDEEDEEEEDEGSGDAVPVNMKMKRVDLEKIARDEGIEDSAIEAAELKGELVDLITGNRENKS